MPLRRFLNNLNQEFQNAAQGLGLSGGGLAYNNYGYGQPPHPNGYGQPVPPGYGQPPMNYGQLPVHYAQPVPPPNPYGQQAPPPPPGYNYQLPPNNASPLSPQIPPFNYQQPPARPGSMTNIINNHVNNFTQQLSSAYQLPSAPSTPIPCPRITPSTHYNDYFTLPQYHQFLVCPTCFNSQVRPTPFASQFIPANLVQGYPVRCCLSKFWVKVAGACLLSSPQNYALEIFPRVAGVVSSDGPCPNSDAGQQQQPLQQRKWFILENNKFCGDCAVHMEVIWHELKGTWKEVIGQGACGLVTTERYDDKSTMETLKHLLSGGVSGFISYLRENTPVQEGQCPRNRLSRFKCHVLASIQEFTVCESCYNEVIKQGNNNSMLAGQVSGVAQVVPGGFTCQLYSGRMRQVWLEVCQRNDVEMLRVKATERKIKERETEIKKMQLKQKAEQLRIQAATQEHLAANAMRVSANEASNNIMLAGVGVAYRVDVNTVAVPSGVVCLKADFSETTRLNNKAARLKVEAAGLEDQIRGVEEEWRRYWE
ncbi:hypothetical protein QBC38DRAFT_119994 [Podospora fimiseda]|uniref:Uncharacterized protein n=1 Tax=Podospora fimiseda TaxID=252190 RepID=A0AAN7GXP6_9PEZI|nr:hypothetical protein QBC38DRAFT_119994 [Podospora fimiseda]